MTVTVVHVCANLLSLDLSSRNPTVVTTDLL